MAARHYVYRIFGERGETLYIGKGVGRRFKLQCSRFKAQGEIMRWFKGEKAAYNHECRMIKKHKPPLNKKAGGGGALERNKAYRPSPEERAIAKLGTRTFVARWLLLNRVAIEQHIVLDIDGLTGRSV